MTDALRVSGLPWEHLSAQAGWPLATDLSSGLGDGSALALGKPGQQAIAGTERYGSFGGRRLPRNLAITTDGRLFLADAANRVIWTALASDGAGERPTDADAHWPFRPLWPARELPQARPEDLQPPPALPADPYTLVEPLAVAIAPNGDLVIVDAGHGDQGRVLVLTLPEARLRHIIPLPRPVAISFDAQGRAHVADAGPSVGDTRPNGRVLRYDRDWRHDPLWPVNPVAGLEQLRDIAHVACCDGCACHQATTDPDCDCGCDCGCGCGCSAGDTPAMYLIAKGRLYACEARGLPLPLAGPGESPWTECSLPASTCIHPPALQLTDGMLSWSDPTLPAHDPLPLPGLRIDRRGRLDGTELPLLARPHRIELPRNGRVQLLARDGGREGFAWDRMVLDAQIPQRTRLLVTTLTRDAALEPEQLDEVPDDQWSTPLPIGPDDAPEVLIQSAPGRYLWLRLELYGDGSSTPQIGAIDLFAPRASSLNRLPVPFHENRESAHFLDRYLSYFDTVFAEVLRINADVSRLFDPQAVPADAFLPWLAGWFDISFLPQWPLATRRDMVARAMEMFRLRGTVDGLRLMLQWHTGVSDPFPAIIEHFRLTEPLWIGGVPLSLENPAHAFTIVLPQTVVADEAARIQLDRVIRAVTPAHTRYALQLLAPGIAIGRQSTLGVDMLIGSVSPQALGEARLGDNAEFPPGRTPSLPLPVQGASCTC